MKKYIKLYIVLLTMLFTNIIPDLSYSLTEESHNKFINESSEYRIADKKLNDLWKKLKIVLPKDEYKNLLNNQRQWLNSRRDNEAITLFEKLSLIDAYVEVINRRINELESKYSNFLQNTVLDKNKKQCEDTGSIKVAYALSIINKLVYNMITEEEAINLAMSHKFSKDVMRIVEIGYKAYKLEIKCRSKTINYSEINDFLDRYNYKYQIFDVSSYINWALPKNITKEESETLDVIKCFLRRIREHTAGYIY